MKTLSLFKVCLMFFFVTITVSVASACDKCRSSQSHRQERVLSDKAYEVRQTVVEVTTVTPRFAGGQVHVRASVPVSCSVCGLVHKAGCCLVNTAEGTVRIIGGTIVDAGATALEVTGGVVNEGGAFLNRTGGRLRRNLGFFDRYHRYR